MTELIDRIFVSNGFMPHGHCYLWIPALVWLHLVADALIAVAYYVLPVLLMYFVHKRRDLPFTWIFFMFGASMGSYLLALGGHQSCHRHHLPDDSCAAHSSGAASPRPA
jgi:hypothetical protein